MNLPKQLSTEGTKNTKTGNTFILTAFFVEPFPTAQVLKKRFFLATTAILIKDICLADRQRRQRSRSL